MHPSAAATPTSSSSPCRRRSRLPAQSVGPTRMAAVWAGVRNRRAKASSTAEAAHNGRIYADGHPSAATRVDALGLLVPLPPSPHPLPLGPRSRAQAASSPIAGSRSTPWAVIVVVRAASGILSVDGAVACDGGGPSWGVVVACHRALAG
jgi:hypothetical protein